MALRCLIVDDSRPFLAAARSLLERQGVSVVGVASRGTEGARLPGPREALRRHRQFQPGGGREA
jgi:CheY-like chemotaxis protein